MGWKQQLLILTAAAAPKSAKPAKGAMKAANGLIPPPESTPYPIKKIIWNYIFRLRTPVGSLISFGHTTFRFLFFVTFGEEVMKAWKYHLIFVYILQGKMCKTEKTGKENHATKWLIHCID